MRLLPRGKKKRLSLEFYDPARQITTTHALKTTDKRIAEFRAAEFLQRFHTADLPAHLKRLDLRLAVEEYLADCALRLRPTHVQKMRGYFADWLPTMAVTQVHELTSERLTEILTQLATVRTWSPKTYNNVRGHWSAFCKWAVRERLLAVQPIPAVPTRQVAHQPVVALTHDELATLFEALRGSWLLQPVALAVYAGLRQGEIKRLEGEDLDFQARTILVGNKAAGMTKSGRYRVVPMSHGLAALLAPWRGTQGRLLPPGQQDLTYALIRFRRTHQPDPLPEHWNWLVFRHTFASLHAHAGTPIDMLMEWLGHTSQAVTRRYYVAPNTAYRADIERVQPPGFAAQSPHGNGTP